MFYKFTCIDEATKITRSELDFFLKRSCDNLVLYLITFIKEAKEPRKVSQKDRNPRHWWLI